MSAILSLLLAQAAPIAPPVPEGLADCVRPTYATDQLVCADPALRAADRDLAGLLATVSPDRLSGRWIEDQQAWFQRSRRCAFQADHARCAAAAYRERADVLTALGTSVPMTGTCRLADGGRMTFGQHGDLVVLIDERGVAAVAGRATASWAPYVSYARARRGTTVRDASGAVLATCTETGKRE